MPGPPKLPSKLKALRGTLEKSRVADNEMQVSELTSAPKPPVHFDKKAKEVWKVTTSALFNIGMLHKIDLDILEKYCFAASTSWQAQKMLLKEGFVQTETNKGGSEYHAKNKWWSIMLDADKQLIKIGQEFGFSPASRTRISMPTKQGNDLDKKMFG